MRKDYFFALMLAFIGIGVGITLMASPPYLESLYLPQPVPQWIWNTCFYAGIIIIVICILIAALILLWPSKVEPLLNIVGLGGRGGNAKIVGKNSRAEGGMGGQGGIGTGGAGGDAEVVGDNSFARGGDGGNSGQLDGRGGRRTMSQGEQLNLPTSMWPYGHGGAGANSPEYNRRLVVLTEIRIEYINAFPCDAVFINAGIDPVPIRWVNKRLEERGEAWRVEMNEGGYEMSPLEIT
jgi:hypothetical protein